MCPHTEGTLTSQGHVTGTKTRHGVHSQGTCRPIQASRVSRFRLERNASWDTLGQKVSTNSTRTQESNKQNREFTEENYGWVSSKPEKYQKLQGSSA